MPETSRKPSTAVTEACRTEFSREEFSAEPREGSGSFRAHYRAVGDAEPARPGTLEHFLVERYCLYATDARNRLYRAEVHHPPWPLQPAEAEIELVSLAPFALQGDPVCHFSRRQDVLVWPLRPVA